MLQTPGTLQINGYLLMSIKIIGGGEQPTKVFLNSSSDLDVDDNLFLPQDSHQPREIFEYQISIFKGEAIVPTLSLSNNSMKKVFSKKPSEALETYIKVCDILEGIVYFRVRLYEATMFLSYLLQNVYSCFNGTCLKLCVCFCYFANS